MNGTGESRDSLLSLELLWRLNQPQVQARGLRGSFVFLPFNPHGLKVYNIPQLHHFHPANSYPCSIQPHLSWWPWPLSSPPTAPNTKSIEHRNVQTKPWSQVPCLLVTGLSVVSLLALSTFGSVCWRGGSLLASSFSTSSGAALSPAQGLAGALAQNNCVEWVKELLVLELSFPLYWTSLKESLFFETKKPE